MSGPHGIRRDFARDPQDFLENSCCWKLPAESWVYRVYPLVNMQKAREKMAIEFVNSSIHPWKMVIFHNYFVCQGVVVFLIAVPFWDLASRGATYPILLDLHTWIYHWSQEGPYPAVRKDALGPAFVRFYVKAVMCCPSVVSFFFVFNPINHQWPHKHI